MTSMSSADHLRRSARDPEAFAGFFDAYFDDLLRYLTRRTCDAEASLDLTAESFAQAYLSRHRFRGSTDREAAAWLYRIAKRQLARYFKRGRAEREACERLGLERPQLDEESERQIERFAALDDLRATLRVELSELSPAPAEQADRVPQRAGDRGARLLDRVRVPREVHDQGAVAGCPRRRATGTSGPARARGRPGASPRRSRAPRGRSRPGWPRASRRRARGRCRRWSRSGRSPPRRRRSAGGPRSARARRGSARPRSRRTPPPRGVLGAWAPTRPRRRRRTSRSRR